MKNNIVKTAGLIAGVACLSFGLSACGSHKHKHIQTGQTGHVDGRYQEDTTGFAGNHTRVGQASDVASRSTATAGLRNVFYFDFNEDTLTPEARSNLTAQADRLRGEGPTIRLEGHADEKGSRQYNMALGERRANAVAGYLQSLGVNSSRFQIVSYGEEKPAAAGSSQRSDALNRRVELK